MKNNIVRGGIIAFVLLYVLSPIDAALGPIDDIIVALLGVAGTAAVSRKR